MTDRDMRMLRRYVRNLIIAEIELSWIGSTHPDDHDQIKRNRKNARFKYKEICIKLQRRLNNADSKE